MLHVDFARETRRLHMWRRQFRAARLRFGAANCECFGGLPEAPVVSVGLRWMGPAQRQVVKGRALALGKKDKELSVSDVAAEVLGFDAVHSFDELYNLLRGL